MQPNPDELLKNSGVLLMSLQKFVATHAREYRSTVEAVQHAEEKIDALPSGTHANEPAPVEKPRGRLKRRFLLAWDAALARSESVLYGASRVLAHASRRLFDWSGRLADRRPVCVFECSVCDQREVDTRCLFTGEQVLCSHCFDAVVERCNAGRRATEPAFTHQMLGELLTLEGAPYWRSTPEAVRWNEQREVRAARWADVHAVDDPVRVRWRLALNPVVCRLAVYKELRTDRAEDPISSMMRQELERALEPGE